MREIKYRVWDKIERVMVEVALIDLHHLKNY